MALITNTKGTGNQATELGGNYKILSLFNVKMGSASDTLTLSAADNGISTIQNVIVTPSEVNATFTYVSASFSGLVVTMSAYAQAGGIATTYGTVNLLVIGS